MTDQQLVQVLIARDEGITQRFFFENCRPLFVSIIRHVFTYEVNYDEFVNEFYLYLMENDAYRLRQFQGRSTIYQWMKIIAIRYFITMRDNMIDMEPKALLLDSVVRTVDREARITAKMDIEYLFNLMPNKRYVHVIQRLVLDEIEPKVVARELRISIDNLYNIKKRAIAALTKVALKEIEKYEKETSR